MKFPAIAFIPRIDRKSMTVELEEFPIVLCKDCWKREFDNCPMEFYFDSHPKDDNFFCAYGEMKEGRG